MYAKTGIAGACSASRRQNVLSGEELEALFPDDEKELVRVWKRPDDMRKERDEIALMFGTLFCVAVCRYAIGRNQGFAPGTGEPSHQFSL
jgi:hypothetical protein